MLINRPHECQWLFCHKIQLALSRERDRAHTWHSLSFHPSALPPLLTPLYPCHSFSLCAQFPMAFWGPSLHTELVAPCLGRSLACLLQLHYCICCSCKSACLAKFMLNKPVPRPPYARSWRDFQLSSSCKCWETFAAIKPTARGGKEGRRERGVDNLNCTFFLWYSKYILSVFSVYSRYFSRIYFISLQPIFPTVSLTIFDFTLLFFNMFSKLHVKLAYTPPPPPSSSLLSAANLLCQSRESWRRQFSALP